MNHKNIIKSVNKEHLRKLISEEIQLNGNHCDLNFIDISNIKDISFLFYNSKFNVYISNWDISNVVDMSYMFTNSIFNNDISNWNTSNVENMSWMFYNSNFNKDISDWDIQNVKQIHNIFYESKSKKIPYWAKINDKNKRLKAYHNYHTQKEKEILLNNLNKKNDLVLKINKDIINF